ncbi:MAG TPA: VCBS repeat-containing protein, partial [Chthonomonadales bacterium]|nr:VCBS repeat-containing protein [Chthonomonadales bacterium]
MVVQHSASRRLFARRGLNRRARLCPEGLLLLALLSGGCHRVGFSPNPAHWPVAAAPADPPPIFTDAAASAGLAFQWSCPGPRPLTILQSIGRGCAFLDYNNDGNLDILLVGPRPALYRGDGRGRFSDVTRAMGLGALHGDFLGCAVGDYDNDGYDDIYLSGYRTGVLLHNEAGKRFRNVTSGSGLKPQPWGTSAIFYDFDNDGRLDLYVGNYVAFGPHTNPQLCTY